jgi:hypothetical protein
MINIASLKKEFPMHKIGELLYLKDNYYIFTQEPKNSLSKEQVENTDFFEVMMYNNWKENEQVYFLNYLYDIVTEKFQIERHIELLYRNILYKSLEECQQIKKIIDIFRQDGHESILLSKDNYLKMLQYFSEKKYEDVEKLLKQIKQ